MISKQNTDITFKIHDGILKLRIISDTIIQVMFNLKENSRLNKSLSVLEIEIPQIKFEVIEEKTTTILKTSKLSIQVDNKTGKIEFFDNSNIPLLKENGRELNEKLMMIEKVYSIKQNFKWDETEALYGLGQHQNIDNQINFRGLSVDLFQGNIKVAIPILISSKGYGILWDNYSYTKFTDTEEGSFLWSEVGDEINYYFIYGPEVDNIIKNIRFLTGKSPMFPKWFFGYVQCKERYKNAEELVGIVEEYRTRNIPLDLIIQDWRYWGSILKWGDKKFVKKRYPHPTQMIDKIHDLNAKIMISIWPIMSIFTSNYKEMKKRKFLYKGGLFHIFKIYDAFNQGARDLYWNQAYEGLFQHGIDAWWCDSTEPMTFELAKESITKVQFAKKSVELLKKTMRYPAIGSAARYLNAFSLFHSKGMYENQRKVSSEKRMVNLTRSGFTGQQRYSTITWSGDVPARWDVFAAQIPAGLNFCITGNPYWTTDIGAFHTKYSKFLLLRKGDYPKGIKDLGFREFYTRWFQFGAFSPMFRSHGTSTPREVWRFGEPGTMFYDTLVKFINLRYRLLSYIYSIAGMVTLQDYTMMRSLIFDFRQDQNIRNINDEYMFGPAFLVCPVLNPMYYDKKSKPINGVERKRDVYLPQGTNWYDFWTAKQYKGGQTIQADAPIDILPLYIRAGSILPINPAMQYSTEKPADPLELRIYRGANGDFMLYEDENDNYNYEKGMYSTIKIAWNDKEKRLTINSRQGQFPGMLEKRTFQILFVNEGKGAGIEEIAKYDDLIEYNGEEIERKY